MEKRVWHFAAGCFILIMGMIVLHTPLSMFIGMIAPSIGEVVKGWKELLLVVVAGICAVVLLRDRQTVKLLMQDSLIRLSLIFIGVHIALTFYQFHGWHAYLAGLASDVRYALVLLVAVTLAIKVPQIRKTTIRVVAVGAAVVGVFGLLQLTVLPHDALKSIGYDWQPGKVAPYITVDGDPAFIRISSTLRGPNPLGFYATVIFALSCARLAVHYKSGWTRKNAIAVGLALLMGMCVWFSYSRGALIAALTAIGTIAIVGSWTRYKRQVVLGIVAVAVLIMLTLTVFRHNNFIATVVFHDSPASGSQTTSNEGHLESLTQGSLLLLRQPLGAGIGSSGSASYYADDIETLYIENQYLYIAHESGWFGLALFVSLFIVLMGKLWKQRKDYLALGLFASGLGLSVTGLVLPVWSDDVVAYIWWGLAGIAIVPQLIQHKGKHSMGRRFINWNKRMSEAFDRWTIPAKWRIDGLQDYRERIVPPLLQHAKVVHDVGGGKLPFVGSVTAKSEGQVVIGFDIDEDELKRAPKGIYDSWVVGDIGGKKLEKPTRKADLVICQVVLEHVKDNEQSIKNIVEHTKRGGTISLFVPSRNAAFARINALLPQRLKERVLFGIFPETRHAQGFPAYYHLCTAAKMRQLLEKNSCEIVEQRHYYQGHYFSFFLPLHAMWRIYQLVAYSITKDAAADFYCLVAVKK